MTTSETLLRPHECVLPTLDQDGSRHWLHPRLAKGRFWWKRRLVAYALIVIFTLVPHLRVHGKPAILLDILHRRFTLLGFTFLPTDTVLLALFMVSLILTVFLVTALLGRVWCGWGCPQTVYLEFVYRPIERLCLGRTGIGGKPKECVAGWRYALMYAAYLVVSLYLAHTFLAYFVGARQLRVWVTESPADHMIAFIVVIAATGAMMFNFAFFREQTCTIACPYGRLQSVLLDRQSLIVSYDTRRGEPRGRVRKTSLPVVNSVNGDCIDCSMCVSVCPTGIDIRDGLQLECIACAQCIDACDTVMSKIGRAPGLIRYGSQAGMAGEVQTWFRPRVIIYPILIAGLLGLLTLLFLTRAAVDVTLMRGMGRPFSITPAGEVDNTMRVKLTNRTDDHQRLHFSILGRSDVRAAATSQETIDLAANATWTEPVQIVAPASAFSLGTLDVTLCISADDGTRTLRPCRLLGPSPINNRDTHAPH